MERLARKERPRFWKRLLDWGPFHQARPTEAEEERDIAFVPRFDVKENANAYVFKADLPGVKQDDLEITLSGHRLQISGKRETAREEKSDRYYAYECSYGSFSRSFTLPEDADVEKIGAALENGVLDITVAKKVGTESRKVPVKAPSSS
jgi:HSP20 family protein